MLLKELKETFSRCSLCPELCESRSQVVFGSGNHKAPLLIIGEAPGASEDRQGIPFCGASGKVLQELLSSIGLTRDDVFITNTIICRPPNNRNPKTEEMQNCRERLEETIQLIQPKVIATVGNFATKAIIKKTGITQIRGQIFETSVRGTSFKVVPVVHPANYLYNGRAEPILEQMKSDFLVLKKVIEEEGSKVKSSQARLGDF